MFTATFTTVTAFFQVSRGESQQSPHGINVEVFAFLEFLFARLLVIHCAWPMAFFIAVPLGVEAVPLVH